MKKVLYYFAIMAAFVIVFMLTTYVCATFNLNGTFIMIIIATLSIGSARLTSVLLKDKLNPTVSNQK